MARRDGERVSAGRRECRRSAGRLCGEGRCAQGSGLQPGAGDLAEGHVECARPRRMGRSCGNLACRAGKGAARREAGCPCVWRSPRQGSGPNDNSRSRAQLLPRPLAAPVGRRARQQGEAVLEGALRRDAPALDGTCVSRAESHHSDDRALSVEPPVLRRIRDHGSPRQGRGRLVVVRLLDLRRVRGVCEGMRARTGDRLLLDLPLGRGTHLVGRAGEEGLHRPRQARHEGVRRLLGAVSRRLREAPEGEGLVRKHGSRARRAQSRGFARRG